MKNLVLTIASFLFITGVSMAQPADTDTNEASHQLEINIPTVSLVDIEDINGEAQSINLTPDVSGIEAGEAVDFSSATDNSLWLNYTSIVEAGNGNGNTPTRNITAEINAGSLPGGINLLLTVAGTSTGDGTLGESVATNLALTSSAQNIVTGIGSCYTESGANKGHQLTYTLGLDAGNFQEIVADSYTVTVLYTISAD